MYSFLGVLGDMFSVGLINIITMQIYKKIGISKYPHSPDDWQHKLKSAAISSIIPLLANKPQILLKPVKRLVGFSKDLVISDQNKIKYISTIPSDRLMTPDECTSIVLSILKNPNIMMFLGSMGIILLLKMYINNKIKEKELEILIRNHQSPIASEHKNKLAIEKYIQKYGNF